MVTIDISSLPIVTSPDVGSTSPCNVSVTDTLPAESTATRTPLPSDSTASAEVIGQSETEMEIETPLSPTPISANQPVPMEVDDNTASSASKPVRTTSETDHRPSLAEILKGQEEVRKDKAIKKAKWKVEMPKPLASDLRAIEQLFQDGRPSWDVLAVHLAAAKPFILPSAKYSIVLETGQTFVRTPPAQILQSFVRDHGNTILDDFFDAGKIGQLAKLPPGNLRLLVTSEEVCQKLAHEKITLMGNQYSFREFDVLGSRYFMDVFGIGPEMSTITIASALHRLGCDVLYENFREAVASKRLSMSTWRVYFRSTSCPEPLVVAGKVCEQICIEGRYYLARGKGAPLPVERLRMGQRSPHCLLLPVNTPKPTQRATKPPTPKTESKSVPSKRTGKTTKPAQEKQNINDKDKKSTSSKATSSSKTDETFCPPTTPEVTTSDRHQKASTSPVSEPEEKLGSSDSLPAEESKQAEESQPAS